MVTLQSQQHAVRVSYSIMKLHLTWHSRTGHSSSRFHFVLSCYKTPLDSNTKPKEAKCGICSSASRTQSEPTRLHVFRLISGLLSGQRVLFVDAANLYLLWCKSSHRCSCSRCRNTGIFLLSGDARPGQRKYCRETFINKNLS